MTAVNISALSSFHHDLHIEVVERKGIGNPDTICDAIAEKLSRTLCRYYLDRFGLILHHNVDKVLLRAGVSEPKFGGGKVIEAIDIYMSGRATGEYKGIKVPLQDLVHSSCVSWLKQNLHALDTDEHVRVHNLVRPGSKDLVELYLRQNETGLAYCNDTSCGVAYSPLSELEHVVLLIENQLNSKKNKSQYPEFGEDIKVMAFKRNNSIYIMIACAFVDRYISNIDDYINKKKQMINQVELLANSITDLPLEVSVNNADDLEKQSVYLTVTGTSAESGDDGEVGRGNRINGLITPYRPMNMEAAAGKNPVSHVGKIYNIVSQKIVNIIADDIDEVSEAYCYMVGQIGRPVNEPGVIDIKIKLKENCALNSVENKIEKIVNYQLSSINDIRKEIMLGSFFVY